MSRRSGRLFRRTFAVGALGALAGLAGGGAAAPLEAQVRRELTFTGGASWESYDGNFSVVTMPTVDSTEHASATVGEFGAKALFFLVERPGQRLTVDLDGGMRQFAATGFHLRDYAPREWVWRGGLAFSQDLALGRIVARASHRGRSVEDRPPMPLFLQPAFSSWLGSAEFLFRQVQGVAFDTRLEVESADYEAPRLLPQLDLLDRKVQGVELGARASGVGDWWVRFYGGLRASQYERQSSGPGQPFRRDRTVNVGALWALDTWVGEGDRLVQANVGVEGIVNRSNSLRPEYDALSVTANGYAQLPWGQLSTRAGALLTWKTYVHQTSFARLVPGEEADNASVVFLDLIRPLASNLSGTLRFGWTRAETDIGNSYYRRFGTSVLLDFRPVF